MDQELALALRERAVAALQTSTTMLKVAQNLLKQGNQSEADRLRNEARYKRKRINTVNGTGKIGGATFIQCREIS
jgi:hypothetical protein